MEGKKYGLFDMIAMGMGNIIGVSIFTTMPIVMGVTGRSVVWGLLLGCFLCILTAIPQAAAASLMKLEGGTYSTGLLLLPKWMSGIFGLSSVIAWLGFASLASAMASYTAQMIPGLSDMQKLVTVVYLLFFFVMNILGPSIMSKLQNVMMIILLVALGIFIVGGFPHIQPDFFGPGMFSGGASGFVASSAMLAMACSGGVFVVNLSADAKNPRRDVPLAMVGSTVCVAVVYFLLAMVAAGGAVPIEDVAAAGNLGVVAQAVLSQPLYLFFMVGGALFALATTLNSMLAIFKYPWMKMAEDGWLPKVLLKTDKKFHYPYVLMGAAFIIGGALPIVFDLSISNIIGLFSFPGYPMMLIMFWNALKIPKKYPNSWKASIFHMPDWLLTVFCVLGIVAEAYLGYSMASLQGIKIVLASLGAFAVLCIICIINYKSGNVKVDYMEEKIQALENTAGQAENA